MLFSHAAMVKDRKAEIVGTAKGEGGLEDTQ